MNATVAGLLDVMSFRLSMLDSGRITPPPAVADATRLLVTELCLLDPSETIEVRVSKDPFHAEYIRSKTNKVLAEFSTDIDEGDL